MYYSDPTANKALSGINREFSRLEKKAKNLRRLYREGKITDRDLEKAQAQFTGIYRHVLTHVLNEPEQEDKSAPPDTGGGRLTLVNQDKSARNFRADDFTI